MRPAPGVHSFILRTPLLPTDALLTFGSDLHAASAAGADLPTALTRDRNTLLARLVALLERPEVDRALAFASPSLHARLADFRRDPASADPTIARALVRYLARMTTRPTPGGLLAGASLGRYGGQTSLRVANASDARLRARMSFDALWSAMVGLAPRAATDAPLHARTLAYEAGGRLRAIALRAEQGGRGYELVDGPPDPPLLKLLSQPPRVPQSTQGTERSMLVQLLELGLLARNPLPSPTSPDALGEMLAWAEQHCVAAVPQLRAIAGALAQLDDTPPGSSRSAELAAVAAIRELAPAGAGAPALRVSLIKPAELSLGQDVVAEIRRAAQVVAALGAPLEDRLAGFRARFSTRYGDAWVPLLHALDEDAGLLFERFDQARLDLHPVLAGLPFAPVAQLPAAPDGLDSAAGGDQPRELVVELPAAPEPVDLGATWFVLASFARSECDPSRLRVAIDGVSSLPLRLLAPLAGDDPGFAELAREVVAAEDDPALVHAEILHLTEGPGADVMVRPRLRASEIPVLASSSADPDDRIELGDMLVTVRDRQVRLFSRRLRKEVRPCLSSPHNAARGGLPLFRFLVAVAEQDRRDRTLRWPEFETAAFRPRMVCGSAVLARARWRIPLQDLAALRKRHAEPAELFAAVRALVGAHGLDRFVSLLESDRKLVVDLENILSIESFADRVSGATEPVVLEEIWPPFGASPVECPEGQLAHEALVVFADGGARSSEPISASQAVTRPARPLELPVSAGPWHCFHLYTSERWIDRALQTCGPIAARLVARGDADRWHFVRYWDPEPHLRVRVRATSPELTLPLDELHAAIRDLVTSQVIWRVTAEPYRPELERYGGPDGVDLAERIACADSELALSLCPLPALLRWDACVLATDALFADLAIAIADRQVVLQLLARHALDTLGGADALLHAARHRQRALRPRFQALFAVPQHPCRDALDRRSLALRALAPRASALRAREPDAWPSIAGSWLHLCMNRQLDDSHRAHELVLGLGLKRHYDERIHRGEG